MSSIENENLLYLLNRWAHRQYENFSTEALAHLIRHLLTYEPSTGVAVLNYLTDGRLALCVDVAQAIDVSTQVTEEMGRPDIEVKGPDRLAYIEIKLEAGLGHEQLARYKHQLKQRGVFHTALVLLTHFFARSAASQLKCIEEFLERCFQALPKIKSDLTAPDPA